MYGNNRGGYGQPNYPNYNQYAQGQYTAYPAQQTNNVNYYGYQNPGKIYCKAKNSNYYFNFLIIQ